MAASVRTTFLFQEFMAASFRDNVFAENNGYQF